MDYSTLSDAEIVRHFSPRLAVPDHERWLNDDAALSAAARGRMACTLDVAYGDTALRKLDIFPAGSAPAPALVFFHGGYWRALDKSVYGFAATGLVPAGIAVVSVNYDLCPAVSVDDIVRQTMASLAWLHRNGSLHGIDPDRLYVAGNSAGAHLAAMALCHDWRGDDLPADLVKGACLITGIYDLTPVLKIEANADIRLRPDMVPRNSPLRLVPRSRAPVTVAVGADEPPLWIAQSCDYAAWLQSHGLPADLMIVPDTNHFSITRSLAEPEGALPRAIRRMVFP